MRIWRPTALLMIALFACGQARGQNLRVVRTAHYRVHTDLDEDLVDDLGRRMDTMYDEYARRLSIFAETADSTPLEVYLVHTQERYLHFAGMALAGTGGSYNVSRKLLAAYLDGQGRESLRRTLQHEAFHQFAARTIGPKLPIWLNEGLAQVFEEGIWTGNGFLLGQVPPRRLRQLSADISQDKLIDFDAMLGMSGAEWASHWREPAAAATEYNQAWAMTQFLVYATDGAGQPKYRARLIQMLQSLHEGEDGMTAFTDAFSGNVSGFRERFLEYAGSLQPTVQAALMDNQAVLADMLIQMKDRGTTFNSMEDFRDMCIRQKWRITYRRGGVTWDSAPDPSVYFTAPDGRMFGADDQYFEISGDGAMPDLVCHCGGLMNLRTRFSEAEGKLEHDTVADAGN